MEPIVQIVIQLKHHIWHECSLGATGQICPMGHLKIQDGGNFFQDDRHFHYIKNYLKNKMHLFGGFPDFLKYI